MYENPDKEMGTSIDQILESLKAGYSTDDRQSILDQLYHSLYLQSNYKLTALSANSFKHRLRFILLKILMLIMSPYVQYHNKYHATLINIIFIQNQYIKELILSQSEENDNKEDDHQC
jgi:hypothetical protein